MHGVAIIRTFTTSLHTPFTSVPELGATSQPFARGTKQPSGYTGSDDGEVLVSVNKAKETTVLSQQLAYMIETKEITGLRRHLKGHFSQNMKYLPGVVSGHADSLGFYLLRF